MMSHLTMTLNVLFLKRFQITGANVEVKMLNEKEDTICMYVCNVNTIQKMDDKMKLFPAV